MPVFCHIENEYHRVFINHEFIVRESSRFQNPERLPSVADCYRKLQSKIVFVGLGFACATERPILAGSVNATRRSRKGWEPVVLVNTAKAAIYIQFQRDSALFQVLYEKHAIGNNVNIHDNLAASSLCLRCSLTENATFVHHPPCLKTAHSTTSNICWQIETLISCDIWSGWKLTSTECAIKYKSTKIIHSLLTMCGTVSRLTFKHRTKSQH